MNKADIYCNYPIKGSSLNYMELAEIIVKTAMAIQNKFGIDHVTVRSIPLSAIGPVEQIFPVDIVKRHIQALKVVQLYLGNNSLINANGGTNYPVDISFMGTNKLVVYIESSDLKYRNETIRDIKKLKDSRRKKNIPHINIAQFEKLNDLPFLRNLSEYTIYNHFFY